METASNQFKEFAELKVHLADCKGSNGQSLQNHMIKVLEHIVVHCPQDALNKFEEISYLIKNQDTLAIEDWLKVNDNREYSKPAQKASKDATAE